MEPIPRPTLGDHPAFYSGYFDIARGNDLATALGHASQAVRETMGNVSPERHDHRYAPGKWTVKEVLQHIIDCERIFTYRALCIARGEIKDLPGFDENTYAAEARTDHLTLVDILRDHEAVRSATIALFESLRSEAWARKGMTNGKPMSVVALGWIIAGHAEHHMRIIRVRYLI